jgi:hypothetical protein
MGHAYEGIHMQKKKKSMAARADFFGLKQMLPLQVLDGLAGREDEVVGHGVREADDFALELLLRSRFDGSVSAVIYGENFFGPNIIN